jgi:hypothetical protein
MEKAAIVVLADPKSGSEESLGRLFNALAAAYDFKRQDISRVPALTLPVGEDVTKTAQFDPERTRV